MLPLRRGVKFTYLVLSLFCNCKYNQSRGTACYIKILNDRGIRFVRDITKNKDNLVTPHDLKIQLDFRYVQLILFTMGC